MASFHILTIDWQIQNEDIEVNEDNEAPIRKSIRQHLGQELGDN